jgi:hemolysin activation/secretion protein
MSTMQNRIVDHGWITTRVLAPSQDLKSGTLKLAIVPGYIRHVTLTNPALQRLARGQSAGSA